MTFLINEPFLFIVISGQLHYFYELHLYECFNKYLDLDKKKHHASDP